MNRSMTIQTSFGYSTEIQAAVISPTLAVHPAVGQRPDLWTLTHAPTGLAIVHTTKRADAVRIGERLATVKLDDRWLSSDGLVAVASIPPPVRVWLKQCCEERKYIPFPALDAAKVPHGGKMPKQKTYKSAQAAQKVVRLLVQAMTPEARKMFHEGLRAAHREAVNDALCEAFEAGQSGAALSSE